MRRVALGVVLLSACAGASSDKDGDGLTLEQEQALGTDPDVADTDGDGWSDGDEVQVGADPLDADSTPYLGGWPVNPDKDRLGNPSWDGVWASEGTQVPRLIARDQLGEDVDLYDFADADVPIVVEVVGWSFDNSKEMGALLSGDRSTLATPTLERLPDLIAERRVWWIRVLSTNRNGDAPYPQDQDLWDQDYPLADSPLLLDQDVNLFRFFSAYWGNTGAPGGFPAMMRVDPATMKVMEPPTASLQWVSELVTSLDE